MNQILWIRSLLCYRKQRVKLNGYFSDWAEVMNGIPHAGARERKISWGQTNRRRDRDAEGVERDGYGEGSPSSWVCPS